MSDSRVLTGIANHGQRVEQLAGFLAKKLSLGVDKLYLPFDAKGCAPRRIPLDSQYSASVPEIYSLSNSFGPAGAPYVPQRVADLTKSGVGPKRVAERVKHVSGDPVTRELPHRRWAVGEHPRTHSASKQIPSRPAEPLIRAKVRKLAVDVDRIDGKS